MKLKRLHLQGFKSFRDRTTIHFDEGITGIVGPNGCGKSNIVDALFWVMGEQSAKHLRGKKMSDLIFAGSNKYKPATWAEVSLVLENDTEKHIHIGNKVVCPSEIQLTRKLYRNNETEYRINNEPCRLKDIHEVFMDTGAGAKSYSIIAQGEINRLVQAKPHERRVMIEEVAGITKFKLRKKESEKKLDKTHENLTRLEDLRIEVHKQLKNLERQSEKAARAKSLRDKIQRHELISASHKEHDFLLQFVEADGKISLHQKIMDEAAGKKETLDGQLDELSQKKEDFDEKIDLKQADFNEQSKLLAQFKERVSSLSNLLSQKEERILSFQESLEESKEIREEKIEKKKNLEESYQAFCEQRVSKDLVEELELNLSQSKANYDELYSEIAKKENQRKDLEATLNKLNHEQEKAEYSLNELSFQLENVAESLEELEGSHYKMNDQVHSLKSSREKVEKEKESEDENFNEKSKLLETLKVEYEKTQLEIKELDSSIIKMESKQEALGNLEKELNSSLQGAEDFLKDNGSDHSLIKDLFDLPVEYAKHFEIAFEQVLSSLCSFGDNISSFENWAKDYEKSSQFYGANEEDDLSEEGLERLSLLNIGEITSFKEFVKTNNDQYEKFKNKLLSGFYIVDSLRPSIVNRLKNFSNINGLIQRDTQAVIRKEGNGFIYKKIDPSSQSLGPVQRRSLLKELAEELKDARYKKEQLEEHFSSKEKELLEAQTSREEALLKLSDLKANLNGLNSEIDLKEQVFSEYEKKRNKVLERKDEISLQRLNLVEKKESFIEDHSQMKLLMEDLSSETNRLSESFSTSKTEYEIIQGEFQNAQAQFESFSSQRQQFESQIEDLSKEGTRYEQKILETDEKLTLFNEELNTLKEEEKDVSVKVEELSTEVEEVENTLQEIKEEAAETYQVFKDYESQLRQAALDYNNSEKSIIKFQANIDRIIEEEELLVRNIFERYFINLRSCLKDFLEIDEEKLIRLSDLSSMYEDVDKREEYQFDKKFPAQVRESREKFKRYKKELARLGEVNWQAIEDYERQKKRHDFLLEQKDELQKSMGDLMQAIHHIDEKSKIRFKEAYEEVNSRFTKVFPIIFGGGNAHLKLIGSLEDPDCGIDIIAQPPGKKMQNINLMSGGEKAMTAVSLIFSIFLVKPSPFCLSLIHI